MKRCKTCGQVKPLDEFYRAATAKDGQRSECKVCDLAGKAARYRAAPSAAIARTKKWQAANRERHLETQRKRRQQPAQKRKEREGHLLRKFGITLDDYERLLKEQRGGCGICGCPPPERGSFHVDHDHSTRAVRGLLCFRCNAGLGQFDESVEKLLAAVAYLEGVRG